MRGLDARIVQDVLRQRTQIIIEIDETVKVDCPRPPPGGAFGDDWIGLHAPKWTPTDPEGWWSIEPESMAMHLLRAAWAVAHRETTETQRDD